MSVHHFDVGIATEFCIEAAVIIDNLSFWIEKNKANEKHFHDGSYWTYNSIKAFNELFPYMSESTIRRVLKTLEENGIIKTGNYNKAGYDRTLWYAITEKGFSLLNKSILSNQQMGLSKTTNGISQNSEPIPDIKPVNKTDSKQIDDAFASFYSQYPKKTNKTDAKKQFVKLLKTGTTLEYILSKLRIYENQIYNEKIESKYIRNPQRFLNTLDDYEDASPYSSSLPRQDSATVAKKCPTCGSLLDQFNTCPKCHIEYDVTGRAI